jgi:hypothetical protein
VRSLSERLRLALGDVTFAESQAQGAELSRAAALALLDSALTGDGPAGAADQVRRT